MNTHCTICGADLPKRFRSYCSTQCRNKASNIRNAVYQKQWQLNKRGEYADDKIQCLICDKWYRQVGSHITQTHKLTARAYREEFKLEVRRGILPDDLRELYGNHALENGTYKNLKNGKKHRFKKGQEGLGVYERSPITIERLKKLHLYALKKQNK